MKATVEYNAKKYQIDLSKPIDISIPVNSNHSVNAWYSKKSSFKAVEMGDWIGSVARGGDVNFYDICFNPHSHCTHTETVGHITKKKQSINQYLQQFFFLAELITIPPIKQKSDFVITKKQLQYALGNKKRDAIVIRTIPNLPDKKNADYLNTNPPYLLEESAIYLREKGIKHLLIDLPSVDKEKDEGKLLSHNAFWNTKEQVRTEATITELIYVPNTVNDGTYFLNLMVAPFENDAAPSKPVLFEIVM